MSDNFKDTAYRMHESSGILFDKEQWFNANYLAGYVCECYCKLVLGMALNSGESLSKNNVQQYRHNVGLMRDDIDYIMLNGTSVMKYCLDLNNTCGNIINEWNPFDRYGSNSHKLNDKELAEKINKEINVLAEKILEMDVDGVI